LQDFLIKMIAHSASALPRTYVNFLLFAQDKLLESVWVKIFGTHRCCSNNDDPIRKLLLNLEWRQFWWDLSYWESTYDLNKFRNQKKSI